MRKLSACKQLNLRYKRSVQYRLLRRFSALISIPFSSLILREVDDMNASPSPSVRLDGQPLIFSMVYENLSDRELSTPRSPITCLICDERAWRQGSPALAFAGTTDGAPCSSRPSAGKRVLLANHLSDASDLIVVLKGHCCTWRTCKNLV